MNVESMTIEINPSLNTYPHNYMETTYKSARKDRLTDIIGDYITDEDTSAEEFFNDLTQELDIWIDYHRKFLEKSKLIKKMVNGHRPIGSPNATGDFTINTWGDYDPQYLAEDILSL